MSGVVIAILVTAASRFLPGLGQSSAEVPLEVHPKFLDLSDKWVLPGSPNEFSMLLKNVSRAEIIIDKISFSCSCASGRIGSSTAFPVHVPSHTSVPLHITVNPKGVGAGPMDLQLGISGHLGDQPVETKAVAFLNLVEHLNADPRFVSLGEVRNSGPLLHKDVTIWIPAELGHPGKLLVKSHDPCISAEVVSISASEAKIGRLDFATLRVTVNPAKAPPKLSSGLSVLSQSSEINIPVLGFFSQSP